MTPLKTWLSGLLVLQLMLALGLFLMNQKHQQANAAEPLLIVDTTALSKLVISENENSIDLTRQNDKWTLPGLKDLLASQSKVERLLTSLTGLNSGWPVATTVSSHERFEVAEDKFQKRVQLYNGDQQLGDLLIGTSPGFRKVHIRKAGDDAVYTAKLNSFEILANNQEWLDKSLLAVDEIKAIKTAEFSLSKDDGNWSLVQNASDISEQQPDLNTVKVEDLVSGISTLRVKTLADDAASESVAKVSPVSIDVSTVDGNHTYQFYKADDKYYVSRNDRDQLFEINSVDYDRVSNIDITQLLVPEQKDESETEAINTTEPAQ